MQPSSLYADQNVSDVDVVVDEEFLLQFKIGQDLFAIKFSHVVEICEYFPYVVYPYQDEKHLGIINLRGTVVPIRAAFKENLRPAILHPLLKYIILSHPDHGRFGILTETVKKISVTKQEFDSFNGLESSLLKTEGLPVRFVSLNSLLESI